MRAESQVKSYLSAVMFYGGLWGLAECTLGYPLHLLSRVIPVSAVAGTIMFPVGLLLMLGALRATGQASSALSAAAVTATIKALSLLLPSVSFQFVRNPLLAILAEGLTVFLVAGVCGIEGGRLLAPQALLMSVGWRVVFLAVNVALGLRGGILAKPAPELLRYLFFDSAVNAVIISAAAYTSRRVSWYPVGRPALPAAVLAVMVAFGAEALFAAI